MASPGGSSPASDGEAEGSVLGTHAHWAAAYAAELAEFEASAGADQGEVWFGEDTQATMVRFVTALVDAEAAAATAAGGSSVPGDAAAQTPEAARAGWRLLDLGCGNGALCVALARAGFTRVLGLDYVAASVELSRRVAAAAGLPGLRFEVDDVLQSAQPDGCADLLVDKGTLDAVGLAPDGPAARKRYAATAARLLRPGGVLCVTSCNATADELAAEFQGQAFSEIDRVRTYPVFRFAGREGTRVATVAFRRT